MNPQLVILRCCRDWPIHIETAYMRNGPCGLCRNIPKLILEPYKPDKTNRNTEP